MTHLFFDEKIHKVASGHVVHTKIEILVVLERVIQLDYPLIVRLGQNVAFGLDVSRLIPVENVAFVENFHGIQALWVVSFAYEIHFAERAYADHFYVLEHGLVHFGASESQIVGLLLLEQASHLLFYVGRKWGLGHLALELSATIFACLMMLQYVLGVLLHEEFEGLWRACAYNGGGLEYGRVYGLI